MCRHKQHATFCSIRRRLYKFEDIPFKCRFYIVFLLKFLNLFYQGYFIHLCLIFEWIDLVIIHFLKNLVLHFLCSSEIRFIRVTRCWHYTSKNYVLSSPFLFHWAIFSFLKLHGCTWWLLELIRFLLCDLIMSPTLYVQQWKPVGTLVYI